MTDLIGLVSKEGPAFVEFLKKVLPTLVHWFKEHRALATQGAAEKLRAKLEADFTADEQAIHEKHADEPQP